MKRARVAAREAQILERQSEITVVMDNSSITCTTRSRASGDRFAQLKQANVGPRQVPTSRPDQTYTWSQDDCAFLDAGEGAGAHS